MNQRITKAVIPIAGKGTRLKPLTRLLPKELLPLGCKPVLAFVFDELIAAGIEESLLIVSPTKTQIEAVFGSEYSGWERETGKSLKLSYAIQLEANGSGDAVRYAETWTQGETFLVAFGDCLIETESETPPVLRMIDECQGMGIENAVLVEKVATEKLSLYGIVAPVEEAELETGKTAILRDIIEKPKIEEALSHFAIAARFLLTAQIFDALRVSKKDVRGEQNIPDALRLLLNDQIAVGATPLLKGEVREDIGSLEGYYTEFARAVEREKNERV